MLKNKKRMFDWQHSLSFMKNIMITSLIQAKQYAYEKISQLTNEVISEDEKALIESAIEQSFFDKIEWMIPEEQLEQIQAETPEEFDAYMFNNIPKYATLLEETVAEFLAGYLTEDDEVEEEIVIE